MFTTSDATTGRRIASGRVPAQRRPAEVEPEVGTAVEAVEAVGAERGDAPAADRGAAATNGGDHGAAAGNSGRGAAASNGGDHGAAASNGRDHGAAAANGGGAHRAVDAGTTTTERPERTSRRRRRHAAGTAAGNGAGPASGGTATLVADPTAADTDTAAPEAEPERVTARAAVRKRSRLVAPSMPTPPTDDEKWVYSRRRLSVVVLASTLSLGCLVVSQSLFVRLSPWLLVLVPLFVFTLLYYLISVLVNAFTPDFDFAAHRHAVERWRPERYPSVDVFLPICGEPVDVLHNTWRHVQRMAEHYAGPVQVYVLDDSATDERAEMALSFGFIHQRRPNRGWYMKAGNLRYAYRRTMGQFILVLDADFSPRHDMLDEMMPYFDADEHLGIVQSPQFFRTHHRQGWLERGAGAVQELFYRLIQVSRQKHGAAICVGSCAVYRRAALDSTGGSTLIEHSEDVHTGFDLRRKGWTLKYLPIPLATGLCPADVNSFFTQQYRWCAGSMSLLGSTKFWNTRMPLRTRLSYLSGFCYYVHTAVFTLAGPVVPILMLAVFPHQVAIFNYVLIAPSLLYNMVLMPLWHKCSYGLEAWTVKMLYGWAHAWAIWDILMGQRMRWQSTGGTGRKRRTTRLWIGMTGWTAATSAVWTGLAAWHLAHTDILAFTPPFLVGAFFLTIVLQAVLVNPVRDLRS